MSEDDATRKKRAPRRSRAGGNPVASSAGEELKPLDSRLRGNDESHRESGAPAPLVRVPVHVRWRDLDAFSHVNNSSFLTYIEEARLQWFQSLPGPWLSEESAPVLAATHVNYRRPIEWPCELDVELHTERLGNTSLTLAHRIVGRADGVLYSDGHSVLVWIDRRDGKPSALPDAVRAACGG